MLIYVQVFVFLLNAQYVRFFLLKYPKITRTVLYILLTCVLTLSQMFRRIFKTREIAILNSGSSLFIASPANDVIVYRKHGNTKDALTCYAVLLDR